LLTSAALVGIFFPQMLWVADFLGNCVGVPLTGFTNYMFDGEHNPLFNRFLSFFHFWLPFLLLYMAFCLGYDRRGVWLWTLVAWAALAISYFFLPPPMNKEQLLAAGYTELTPNNVNYVYALGGNEPQTWMEAPVFFAVMLVAWPVVIYVPSHLLFQRVLPNHATRGKHARSP
jgi:hypothetical protein